MSYNQEQLQNEILSFQNQLNNTYSTFGSQQQNHQQNNNSNTFRPRNSNEGEKDIEYRDTINEKVNNLKFTHPNQERAKHFFDDSFINNNPQYYNINGESNSNNINNNLSRKDSRDGMNNKMDDLKFQRFENQDIPSSIKVRENERSFQDPPSFFNSSQNYQQQQNNQQNQNISNRFSNKDLNNERMQSLATLPRALHQPMKMVNEQPAYVSFKSSFEDQYKSYNQNQTQSPSRFETDTNINFNTQNNSNIQQNYNNNQQQHFLPDENLLRRNESSRENYKDSHNKRLSELSPLARTCAIPTTDYTQSIQQNTQMLNQNRNSRINDTQNRKEAADIKTKEWRSTPTHINNPIHNPIQTHKLIIQTDRPIDTRQTF